MPLVLNVNDGIVKYIKGLGYNISRDLLAQKAVE